MKEREAMDFELFHMKIQVLAKKKNYATKKKRFI